jgi:hypothetical protein
VWDCPTLPCQAAMAEDGVRACSSRHIRRMTRLARWRLWARLASRRVFPWVVFRVRYSWASGRSRCWVAEAMWRTLLMRRLPRKSRRCLTGSPSPSPEESATAPVPQPASELGLPGEPERIGDFAYQGCRSDGCDAWFVTEGGAVFIEEFIDELFQTADLGSHLTVLVDERDQPRQPILPGPGCRLCWCRWFRDDAAWIQSSLSG